MNENQTDTTTGTANRRLVAVPDPQAGANSPTELFRLGVESTGPEATFTIGETGPAGQRLPWIYMKAGESIRYEIDLENGTLTVVITNPETGQSRVVVYKIDVEAMQQLVVETGKPATIVFAYDERLFDETPEIDEWCATTGPRYVEELRTRLGNISTAVVELQDAVENAKESGKYAEATQAPPSAELRLGKQQERSAGHRNAPSRQEVETIEVELDETLPEGVQIYDPISGKTFVGRRWARPHEQTTIDALVAGGYKLAVVRFRNGDIATLMPNFSGKKLAIQIKTAKGTMGRVLHEEANEAPIGPGIRINVEMSHTIEGSHEVEGKMLTTPPIVLVVGVGPEATAKNLPYPSDTTLEEFRGVEPPGRDGPTFDRSFQRAS